MKALLTIVSILLFIEINSFKCGSHYLRQNEIKIINPIKKVKNYRNLQSTTHPIKIYVDFEILENLFKNGSISQEYYSNLTLGLNSTINYLKKLIYVTGPQSLYIESNYFPLSNGSIIQNDIPKLINNEIKADLILIPKISFEDDGSHGGSYIIALNENDKRPIIGGIILKTHYNFSKTNSQFFIIMFLLHEITHILGFESFLFPYFKSGSQLITKNINGIEKQLFTGENVIKYAKKHFGCDNIDGIELENQIGGTHWESRIMLSDYMIGFDYSEIVISEISLALLEDSGWYKINYYTGGLFRYGKGEGCDFLFNKCVTKGNVNFKKDFCIKNGQQKCTSGHLSRGKCYMKRYYSGFESYYQYYEDPLYGGNKYTDYCPIPEDQYYLFYYNNLCDSNSRRSNYPNEFGEKYGDNSICIESSLVPYNYLNSYFDDEVRVMCHEIKCDFKSKTFSIYVGNNNVKCPGEYKEVNVDGFSGSIFCPDFDRVCTGRIWCINPLNCIDKKSKNVVFDELNENEEEENIGISENENDNINLEENNEIENNININLFEEEEINLEEEELEEIINEYEDEEENNNLNEEEDIDEIYQNMNEENKKEDEINDIIENDEKENNIILYEEEELEYNEEEEEELEYNEEEEEELEYNEEEEEEEEDNIIILDFENKELEELNEYYNEEEEELDYNEDEEESQENNNIFNFEEEKYLEYEEEEKNIILEEENMELKKIKEYEEEENNFIYEEEEELEYNEEEELEYNEEEELKYIEEENKKILEQDLDKINVNEENYNYKEKEIEEDDEKEENDINYIKDKDNIDWTKEEKETNKKEENDDLYNENIEEENNNINKEKVKENLNEIKDDNGGKIKENEIETKNGTFSKSNIINISFPVLIILFICLII